MYMYTCIYIYIYIFLYVYIYILLVMYRANPKIIGAVEDRVHVRGLDVVGRVEAGRLAGEPVHRA